MLIIAFAVTVVVSIVAGMLAHRRSWAAFGGGPTAWGEAAGRRFGAIGGAVLVAIVGWVVVTCVGLALGFLAKALEDSVDKPTFRWISPRVHDNAFTRLNEKLTYMGNNPIVQIVVLVAVIVLVCAYKRRWWIPIVGIGGAYFGEHYLQKLLARVVHRGHPPTSAGTFPSGGVGRILAVYGAIIVLVIILQPALSRAWKAGLWTGVATAAVIECFTRVYLSKHWLTDAVFGLPFGALLLLTNAAAIASLAYRTPHPNRIETNAGKHLAPSGL